MTDLVTSGRSGAAPKLPLRAIPEATVARLTSYLGILTRTATAPNGTISSEELAVLAGVNPAKLRKDLSYLGSHGTRGVGYDAASLTSALQDALGAHREYPVAIIGCGHLGSALAGYPGFISRGFPVRVLLDSDPAKVGTVIAGVRVTDISEAVVACREEQVVIGVIATPEASAQRVAEVLITAGVKSILNFAPAPLTVPGDVEVRRVDLALELNLLAFHESRRDAYQTSPLLLTSPPRSR